MTLAQTMKDIGDSQDRELVAHRAQLALESISANTENTSSILDTNLFYLITFLKKALPSIAEVDLQSTKEILKGLESLEKELAKDVKGIVSIDNFKTLSDPLNKTLDQILGYLKDQKAPIVNVPEPVINIESPKAPIVNVPAPIVNIPAPIVNVPKTTVNVPELDLSPILNAIRDYLTNIRDNDEKNPLAVRLSDGTNWIEELKILGDKVTEAGDKVGKGMSVWTTGSRTVFLRNALGIRINPATSDSPSTLLNGKVTVTTAGTRVQVSSSSVTIKGITVKSLAANTGIIYVGNATVSSANGYALAAGQAISFDIDNLNKVYLDSSVSAESVTYLAVS